MSRGIQPIRPPQHARAPIFPVKFVLGGKIVSDPFGHDPLLTPTRLPPGVRPHPFADVAIAFEQGATLDVVQ